MLDPELVEAAQRALGQRPLDLQRIATRLPVLCQLSRANMHAKCALVPCHVDTQLVCGCICATMLRAGSSAQTYQCRSSHRQGENC